MKPAIVLFYLNPPITREKKSENDILNIQRKTKAIRFVFLFIDLRKKEK